MACHRSQSCCRPSQKSAGIPRTRSNRRAVSGVTERRPLTISFNRGYETPNRIANALWDNPSGFRNSSSSISPGCVGGRFLGSLRRTFRLMVVRDFDFVGMAFLPLETDPKFLIDSDAELMFSISTQAFQMIPWWDREFSYLADTVDLVKLSPGNRPQRTRTALPGDPRIGAVKNVFRRLASE